MSDDTEPQSNLSALADQLCESQPDQAYKLVVNGHKVLVIKTMYGNAYSPVDLIAEGDFIQAAQVSAQAAFQEHIGRLAADYDEDMAQALGVPHNDG